MKLYFKNVLLLALVTGAVVPVSADNADLAYLAQVDNSFEWPEPQKATRKNGAFVPVTNIAKVIPGMTKKQVYTLLDVPHFSEGLFGVRTWNYLLNFYTGNGGEYLRCQFHIRYDRERRVESASWRSQDCADLVSRYLAPPAPQVVEKIVYRDAVKVKPDFERSEAYLPRNYVVTFDSSSAELSGEAIAILETAVAAAAKLNSNILMVTGYTDTVGSESANVRLRDRRATNVATALTMIAAQSGGVLMVAKGTSADLIVQTGDEVAEQANRRVVVNLN